MHALLPRLLVAFTAGTACATPLLAQDQRDAPAPWLALEATVFHEGQPVSVVVDRASREARLFELRPGRDPIRHPLIVLSPELVARLDAAMTKAKPAASEELGPTSDPAQIQALQRHLNELGYPLQDDGDYGDATERAVRRFQAAEDLPVTGRVDSETRGRMGFVPPAGQVRLDGGREVAGRALAGELDLVVESALRGAEPEPTVVSGRLRDGGRTLETRDGTRYSLEGVHSGWDQALGKVPSAQLQLLVWPGTQEAVVTGIRVQAVSNSLPFGVALDSLVDVIGLTSVPERSVPGNLGSRKVGGRVLLVRDPAGRTGTLHDPASARAPRPSTVGAVGALSGLGAE